MFKMWKFNYVRLMVFLHDIFVLLHRMMNKYFACNVKIQQVHELFYMALLCCFLVLLLIFTQKIAQVFVLQILVQKKIECGKRKKERNEEGCKYGNKEAERV